MTQQEIMQRAHEDGENEPASSFAEAEEAAKRLIYPELWVAYLGDMLLGEGPTREAAIEAAVREYEETSGTESGYAEDERDVHLFRSRDELVARLDVSLAAED